MAMPRRRWMAGSGKIDVRAWLLSMLTAGAKRIKLQPLARVGGRLSSRRRSAVQIVEIGQVVARPLENECLFDWADVDDTEMGNSIIEAFADGLPPTDAEDLREDYRRALAVTSAR